MDRHGAVQVAPGPFEVVLTAVDGAVAGVEVPFPPLALPAVPGCQAVDESWPAEDLTGREQAALGTAAAALVAHALAERTVGVLLVRRGGHAAGVFTGPRLVASKVGSRHVQGRTAAGGWSQQRFARRRAGQTAVAWAAAADDAARVLLGHDLEALVAGGDRTAVDEVLADPRLAPLRPLRTGRLLPVPDPRLKVLQELPFRDVRIRLQDQVRD